MTLALIILTLISVIHKPLYEIIPDNYKWWYMLAFSLFSLYAMKDLRHLSFIGLFLWLIATISLSIIIRLIVDWLKQDGIVA